MNPDLILKIAGWISAVAGAIIVLWRYIVEPCATAIRSLKDHSEQISDALPLLGDLLERWPSQSGPASFFGYIDQLERLNRSNEALTQAILNLWETPVYECNTGGECGFANNALCDLFGLSREAMLGVGWLRGIVPEERERVYDAWMAALDKKIPYECTYTVRNAKTGDHFRMTTYAIPLIYQGEIYGYLGAYKNIKPIELMHPQRRILLTKIAPDGKIHLTLDCGHVFGVPDNDQARAYLNKNPPIVCSQCSPGSQDGF